jgi:hypothetical protein
VKGYKMTPLETVQAALRAAEEHVGELECMQHQIDQERGAARAAGNNALHTQLNDQMNASNVELRIARAAVEEARVGVRREQQRISRARSTAADLANRERWLARQAPEATARAQALESELVEVKSKRAEAEQQLAQLEPPEQPVTETTPEPATEPTERDPQWPQPARMVFGYGDGGSRYFDKDNNSVDPNGRPLDLSELPAPQPKPGQKDAPQAAQSAPNLFD